jgi:hypothetical protein
MPPPARRTKKRKAERSTTITRNLEISPAVHRAVEERPFKGRETVLRI